MGWLPLDIGLYCAESLRAQGFQERLLLDTADLVQQHDTRTVEALARAEMELEQLQNSPPIVVAGTVSLTADGQWVERERESEESIAQQRRAQDYHLQRQRELTALRDHFARQTIESFSAQVAPLADSTRLGDVRGVLGVDELFLEFILLGQTGDSVRPMDDIVGLSSWVRPDQAFVIAVTHSWMDVIPLGQTAEIELRCERLLDMLGRFGPSLSLPFFQVEAVRTFDNILRPVWNRAGDALRAVQHLVIAPDGVLYKLPLDLLVEGMNDASTWREVAFLARRYTTEYTPSATLFVDFRRGRYRRGEPGHCFVGLGDPTYDPSWQPVPLEPLPGTRRELEAITTLLRDADPQAASNSVRLLLANEATKVQLTTREVLENAEYLHLACHGSAGAPPFADGAIFLAQTPGATVAQCTLTAREVMDIRTHAKLVVLSACESGLGTLRRGEGIQGLTRAWLFAGAQAVAASCWRVDDDATAEVMANFYRALLRGDGSVADALAEAKRAALESESFACPVSWGAFVLTGGRTVPDSLSRPLWNTKAISVSGSPHTPSSLPISLSHPERELLTTCARAWENAWGRKRATFLPMFCVAATQLGHALATAGRASGISTATPLGLVARNCRVAWEYGARQNEMAHAVQAYHAYVAWVPSARTEEADAVAAAYRPENRTAVRRLTRQGRLTRTFELNVDGSLNTTLRTTVTWSEGTTASETVLSVEVALPAEENVACDGAHFRYCRESGWAVFRIASGETVSLTERLPSAVVTLEADTFLLAGIWGSLIVPHELTIQLHPDFIPLRLEREPVGKGRSVATVRFVPEGTIVTLRTSQRSWLERVALLFRRAVGALDLLTVPNSPFRAEMEFEEYEQLWRDAKQRI